MTGFANVTDPTNKEAEFVGSSSCVECHAEIGAWHQLHGHAHQLTPILGGAPSFPAPAERAGVPAPPVGFAWTDISWMIGGFAKKARFIDRDGFLLTNGLAGVDSQWNLSFPANGSVAGFVPFETERMEPLPYDESCFRCHTTGAQPFDPIVPRFQEGRPGLQGTWEEAGIQCEACHGPGSHHFGSEGANVEIDRSAIFVDSSGADSCNDCHNRREGAADGVIRATDGYIEPEQQYAELLASGGHAEFACTFCHDPHRSVVYDRPNAIRNECTVCHAEQNMALHAGFEFRRGDYVETLSCESCHMPFATRSATSAAPEMVGEIGRMGDTRTHIFRVETDEEKLSFASMFAENGAVVRQDAQGRAAITVDFVCLRCHNGMGNAFPIQIENANEIAFQMHGIP